MLSPQGATHTRVKEVRDWQKRECRKVRGGGPMLFSRNEIIKIRNFIKMASPPVCLWLRACAHTHHYIHTITISRSAPTDIGSTTECLVPGEPTWMECCVCIGPEHSTLHQHYFYHSQRPLFRQIKVVDKEACRQELLHSRLTVFILYQASEGEM